MTQNLEMILLAVTEDDLFRFLSGTVKEGQVLAKRLHGKRIVHKDTYVADSRFQGVIDRQDGLGKGQDDKGHRQQPGQKDQEIAQFVARRCLLLYFTKKT